MTVAKPIERGVVDQDEYVGRFVAVDSVEVRARVSGYLDKVHFRDGQMVKQGDLLFTIDKRPFQNTLDQARANLAQAKANLAFTEADLERAKQLVRDRTITEQTFDQRTQAFAARHGLGRGERGGGAPGRARSGIHRAARAGRRPHRRPPRLARQSRRPAARCRATTLLATIVSIDPIRFEFTFDEASYLRYERFSHSGKEVTGREGGVTGRAQAARREGLRPPRHTWISSTT